MTLIRSRDILQIASGAQSNVIQLVVHNIEPIKAETKFLVIPLT